MSKTKQYLYQAQDEAHYLRLSLCIAVAHHTLLPQYEALGMSAHDAFDLRSTTASTQHKGKRDAGGGGAASAGSNGSFHVQHTASSVSSVSFTDLGGGAGGSVGERVVEIVGAVWSLCEDKLLVRCDEARGDLVAAYSAFHRANPVLYPKMCTDPAIFRARLAVLHEDPVRMKLVQLMPEDGVTQLDQHSMDELTRKSSGLFSSPNAPAAAAASAGSAQRTKVAASRALKRNQQQRPAVGMASSAYRKEDLILTGVVRQGTEQSDVICCSEDITAQSPLLRDLFNRSSDYQPGGAKRVVLTEKDPMWSTIPDMCSVFASDNLNRFKTFCEAPSLLTTLVDVHERLKVKEEQMIEEWDEVVNTTFKKRDEQLEMIDALKRNVTRQLHQKIERAMEKDIEAIKELYAAHIHQETKKLHNFFHQQKTNMELYYEREIASLSALRNVLDETSDPDESMAELRAEVNALSEMTSDTFGPPYLPRLLMLADVVLCGELRSQCLKLIAADLSRYVQLPEMNSELLRANTFRELMTLIPDAELQRVHRLIRSKGVAHRGIPLAMVEQEVKERSEARLQELVRRDLSNVQDLIRRVNNLVARIKHNQAASVVGGGGGSGSGGGGGGGQALLSPVSPSSPRSLSPLALSPNHTSALRTAYHFARAKAQAKTPEDLRRGISEEELFLNWRELLQETLSKKLQDTHGEYNVAVVRVPRKMEGSCSVLPHRKGFDVKQAFKYVSAEGQGAAVIGESNFLLYWEARVTFVDSGTRFPANVYVGMEPVAQSMNPMQVEKLNKLLKREREMSMSASMLSDEKMQREKHKAHVLVGPSQAAIQSASAPAFALLRNFLPLAQTNALAMANERIVGITPITVSFSAAVSSSSSSEPALETSPPSSPSTASSSSTTVLYGVSWSNEGTLNVDGVPFDVKTCFDVGDAIGVSLHTLTGELRFYKNGTPLHFDHNVPVPLLRQGVAYQPCITVYCSPLNMSGVASGTSGSGSGQSGGGGAAASLLLSNPGTASLIHQSVPCDEDTVIISQTGGLMPPKARVLVELDGQCRVMPPGSVAFSKGAVPACTLERHM